MYVEIAKGNPGNRGYLINKDELGTFISKNPLYRSVYLYDESALEYVE